MFVVALRCMFDGVKIRAPNGLLCPSAGVYIAGCCVPFAFSLLGGSGGTVIRSWLKNMQLFVFGLFLLAYRVIFLLGA